MYLQKEDYTSRINIDLLEMLLYEDEAGKLKMADHIAVGSIKTKAGVLYDTSAEFTKTGDDRDGYLMGLALSIALYEIYQRRDDEDVPEKVIKNYDDAIETLEQVAAGKSRLNLPPKPREPSTGSGGEESSETSGNGLRRLGSQPKRTHNI